MPISRLPSGIRLQDGRLLGGSDIAFHFFSAKKIPTSCWAIQILYTFVTDNGVTATYGVGQ